MNLLNIQRRFDLAGILAAIYFLSVFLVASLPFKPLGSLAFGLLLSSLGSLTIVLLLRQWEKTGIKNNFKQNAFPNSQSLGSNPFLSAENFQEIEIALREAQERQKELVEELNGKNDTLHHLKTEKNQFDQRIEDLSHELEAYKNETQDELRRKTVLLSEYQETINQQRDVIKKKQELISELESKVQDLNYEVKTLLQLAELSSEKGDEEKPKDRERSQSVQAYQVDMFEEEETSTDRRSHLVKSPEEASYQLKRCVDIAQKITGGNHFGNGNSRFREIAIDNRALDLRRLFDNLQTETSGTVIVYSQKENKLLFANNQTASLLGWKPEKFIKDFKEIIAEGKDEWKKGVLELAQSSDTKVRLVMKTNSGHNLLVYCHLGVIRTGAFRNHIIGVLYPA